MKKFFPGGPGWLAMALLTACHAAPEHPTAAPAAASPAAAVAPIRATPAAPNAAPAPPCLGYHRYRGTVGGRPVTLELTIDSTETGSRKQLACTGSYYYGQAQGGLLNLAAEGTYQPQQLLRLQESVGGKVSGTWQATQPAGPLLAGTWSSPSGRQLPFSLHEDYTDGQGHVAAVRYEVLTSMVELPCRLEHYQEETAAEYRARVANAPHGYRQQFLHLLGPDTLRPSLRILQCPAPRERRRLTRVAAKENGGCNSHEASLQVDYNAYGLLAWSEYWEDDFEGGARPAHGMSATAYDLRTGGVFTMADVLRPGTDTLLQRLITQHILHGDSPDIEPTPRMAVPTHADDLAPVPQDFSLTEQGLEFGYEIDSLARFTEGGTILCWVTVPYPELLPLLRPTSPVARMLRERGLWRGDGKKSR